MRVRGGRGGLHVPGGVCGRGHGDGRQLDVVPVGAEEAAGREHGEDACADGAVGPVQGDSGSRGDALPQRVSRLLPPPRQREFPRRVQEHEAGQHILERGLCVDFHGAGRADERDAGGISGGGGLVPAVPAEPVGRGVLPGGAVRALLAGHHGTPVQLGAGRARAARGAAHGEYKDAVAEVVRGEEEPGVGVVVVVSGAVGREADCGGGGRLAVLPGAAGEQGGVRDRVVGEDQHRGHTGALLLVPALADLRDPLRARRRGADIQRGGCQVVRQRVFRVGQISGHLLAGYLRRAGEEPVEEFGSRHRGGGAGRRRSQVGCWYRAAKDSTAARETEEEGNQD